MLNSEATCLVDFLVCQLTVSIELQSLTGASPCKKSTGLPEQILPLSEDVSASRKIPKFSTQI
jgi:hypothetical protein